MSIHWISERLRRSYRAQAAFDIGERDERRVRSELAPRTGHVLPYSDLPLSRRVLAGAHGLSPEYQEER